MEVRPRDGTYREKPVGSGENSLRRYSQEIQRARWRGLVKQSIQDLLVATIQNLRKLIGAIQNVPQSAWKPLIRTLSWLCVMLSALCTPDPPGRLVLTPI
jgi:hypothetical protein